jgi:hypothetical protein
MSEMPIEAVDASKNPKPQPKDDASMNNQAETGADELTLV